MTHYQQQQQQQQQVSNQKTPPLLAVRKTASYVPTTTGSFNERQLPPAIKASSHSSRNNLLKVLSPLSGRDDTPRKKASHNLSTVLDDRPPSKQRQHSRSRKNQLSIAIPSEEKSFDSVSFARVVTKPTTPTKVSNNQKVTVKRAKSPNSRSITPNKSINEQRLNSPTAAENNNNIQKSARRPSMRIKSPTVLRPRIQTAISRTNSDKTNSESAPINLENKHSKDKKNKNSMTHTNSTITESVSLREKQKIIIDALSVELFYSNENQEFKEMLTAMMLAVYPILQLWDDVSKHVAIGQGDSIVFQEIQKICSSSEHWRLELYGHVYQDLKLEVSKRSGKPFNFKSPAVFVRRSVIDAITLASKALNNSNNCNSDLPQNQVSIDSNVQFLDLIKKAIFATPQDDVKKVNKAVFGVANRTDNNNDKNNSSSSSNNNNNNNNSIDRNSNKKLVLSDLTQTETKIIQEEDIDDEEEDDDDYDDNEHSRQKQNRKRIRRPIKHFIDFTDCIAALGKSDLVRKARTILIDIPLRCEKILFVLDFSNVLHNQLLAACLLLASNLYDGYFAHQELNYVSLFELFSTSVEKNWRKVTLQYGVISKKFKLVH